jgi:dTDP-4-amino-4,6-dideoxygalactose transaminase
MPRHYRRGQTSVLFALQHLRRLTGRSRVLLTGRAAAGIWAALRALGLQNRWIAIPANTCYIVLWAVVFSGNKPLLVDIDPETGNISSETLKNLPVQPAAIIPCHLYGLPAPMTAICDWARAHNILVIEDAAQAIGTKVEGKPSGGWGDVSVFSFGQGKIVDMELGGALLTDDERLSKEVEKILADVPVWDKHLADLTEQWDQIYWALHQFESKNSRLPQFYSQLFEIYKELIAYRLPPSFWAGLPEALEELPDNLQNRAQIATLYDDRLRGFPIHTLSRSEDSALWRYPLLVAPDRRDDLLRHLWQNGFYDVTCWYPSLRYMLSGLVPDGFIPPTPGADKLSAEIINLPVRISPDAAIRTADAICRYFDE